MIVLKSAVKEQKLARQVLCSLLSAGVMSICISGGDVWASDTVTLTQDTTYNDIGEIPQHIIMNGKNITSYDMLGNGSDDRSITGAGTETLTIANVENKLNVGVGAFFDKNSRIVLSKIKIIDIQGDWSRDIKSALYTNNQGSITMNDIGSFKISGGNDNGVGIHAMSGTISINAETVSVKDVANAVFGQLNEDGKQESSRIEITTTGDMEFLAKATAVAAVNLSQSFSNNSALVSLSGQNVTIKSSEGRALGSYATSAGSNNAKTTAIVKAKDTVTIEAATNGVYADGGREQGDAFISIEAGKNINIAGSENAVYAGSNSLIQINEQGTAKVNLSGNVFVQGGKIVIANANQTGRIKVDGGQYAGTNVNLIYDAPTVKDNAAVYIGNGSRATFDGDKTEINIVSTALNDPRGVWLQNSSNVEFNAKETFIDVKGVGGSSKWGFGLLLNGTGNSALFNGNKVTIKNYQDKYTSQTVTAKADSKIVFNNTGSVVISAESPYGVTAVDNQGSITFNNQGDIDISGTITPGDKTGNTNVIGIQSGTYGAKTIVTDRVKDFNITLTGAGVDNDGTSYSSGTSAIYLYEGVIANINSKTFNIIMNIDKDTSVEIPETHTSKIAYGLQPDGGEINVGAATKTNITINEGLGIGYGVYANNKSIVNILGDTDIKIAGKDGSYALYANAMYWDEDGNKKPILIKGQDGGKITVGSTGKTVVLTGDVVAEDNGVINIAGKTNTINGTIAALNGGMVNLNGGSDAVYNNIDINSFVTNGGTTSGTIKLSGGTMDFGQFNNQNLAADSFIVAGGSLKAASEDIFTKGLEAGTASASGEVLSVVDNAVKFESGKLILTDAKYNLDWLKKAKTALHDADGGTIGLVVTGTLVNADGQELTEAKADDLAATGAVHAGVTGKVDNKDVTIGSGGFENLGVKDLSLGGTAADASKVTVGAGKELTLVGGGNESDALVKTADGAAKTNVTVAVGDSGNAGTLNLGVAGANSGGNLNASVAITNDDSKVNVDAGTFKVKEISAEKGTISVNEGAALKTDSLTVGTEGSTTNITGAGALEAKEMNINKGTVAVTGSLKAESLTVNDSGATITVGDSGSAGSLAAKAVELKGSSIVLDPVWNGVSNITTASKGALEFASAVDGKLTVGQNSVLSLGTNDTSKAEAVFANSGLSWGEQDITAALYIDKVQTLDTTSGGIKVDGNLTHGSNAGDFAQSNTAYFANKSLLMVNSSLLGDNVGALSAAGGTLTVTAGAKLYIENAEAGKTYTVVSGFNNGSDVKGWGLDEANNLLLNKLVTVVENGIKFDNGTYTVETAKVNAKTALPGVALPNILNAMTPDVDSEYAGIKYLSNVLSDLNTDAQALAAVNGFAQGAENSGAAHSGTMAAFTIGDTIQSRMSLANDVAAPQGGKGKGTDAADNGSIWAQYIHNKDKVDNLGGISYDGQYNGVIIGGDFAPNGKYHSGVAFSYGDGSSTGSVSKNDFDFWGLSYYGSIKNDDTNVIFDAGYSKTSNDIKGAVDIDSDTKVFTLGVKGEKLINNGHGTSYVPYAGLRYLNVDGGSYNGTIGGEVAANYSADKANIWMLPIGIGVHHETVTADGWKLRPMADIAYVWTFGDNNSAMDVTVPGVNATDRLGYDIMDSGFFVGKLGVEAEKGDWTYGLGYAYQKGSHAQNNKFTVNVTYSF